MLARPELTTVPVFYQIADRRGLQEGRQKRVVKRGWFSNHPFDDPIRPVRDAPPISELWAHTSSSKGWPRFGRNRANAARIWPYVARIWPMWAKFGRALAKLGQIWSKSGQHWPDLDNSWPMLGKLGRIRPDVDESGPNLDESFWSSLAELVPNLAGIGAHIRPTYPKVGHIWSKFHRLRVIFGPKRLPESGRNRRSQLV